MEIRDERPDEQDSVRQVIEAAFADAAHGSGVEAAIVDALRAAEALTLSLVAEQDGRIVGHLALSPVTIEGRAEAWFGLGPVSVRPDVQRRGIGQALIRHGLGRLERSGARGCVVVGDPLYYGRFGFEPDSQLAYADVPPPYLQRLSFGEDRPSGGVAYHPAFEAAEG